MSTHIDIVISLTIFILSTQITLVNSQGQLFSVKDENQKDTDITIKHTQNNVTIKSEKNNHKEDYPKEHEQRETLTLPKPTLSEDIELVGIVNYVVDGDTLDINDIRIRLSLVDTPERGYPGFKEAKEFVKKLCLEENAEVDMDDNQRRGSFGREIGVVYCDGKNLNEELMKNDLAIIDTEFCDISEFSSEIWAKPYC